MDSPKKPKTKENQKKGKNPVANRSLMEELDLMSDIVFRMNLPQQVQKKVKKSGKATPERTLAYVPISVTFRARRYPVCTSAFPKEPENPLPPLGDVDELLGWPALHHTVSWIHGVHIMDLNKVFKRHISRKIMMQDAVARIGGRASLDLIFPQLSRDNFQRMIDDEYEGSQIVADLKKKELLNKAEALRKQEILTMVNSRTRKSWGANRIIPVWFLIWMLEWDYLRPHFLKFNTKFGVCSQIADAMRCKMQTGSGSNDTDRELLDQSRKIMKSMEIVSSQGNLTLLQSRTRDLVSIDLACRRLFNKRDRAWRLRDPNSIPAEAEEVWSSGSASKRHGTKDSIPVRVADLEEAVDTEILVTTGKMERMKSDIRMLALKLHIMERKQNSLLSSRRRQTNPASNQRGFFSAEDSEEDEKNEEYFDCFRGTTTTTTTGQDISSLAISDSDSFSSSSESSSSSSDSSGDDDDEEEPNESSSSSDSETENKTQTKPRKRPRWKRRQRTRAKKNKRIQKKQRRRY